jgi:hypothetical protein
MTLSGTSDSQPARDERRWTLRVCKQCGSHHQHYHDGCVTYSNAMFPQMTEWAGAEAVEVMPVSEHEAALARLENSVECKRQAFEVAEGGRKLWMERAEKAEAAARQVDEATLDAMLERAKSVRLFGLRCDELNYEDSGHPDVRHDDRRRAYGDFIWVGDLRAALLAALTARPEENG